MPDQTARDAAISALRGVFGPPCKWMGDDLDHDAIDAVLAALGIPPDTTVQDVREALALLDRDRTGKAWLDAPYLETDHA